jgi:hypothetical protein
VHADPQPEPKRRDSTVSPAVNKYPVAHHAVVLVVQCMNGNTTTHVSVGAVCWTLCHRKYASTRQEAMNMIEAARVAKVIRVSGDHVIYLEDPRLSRSD